MKTHTPKRYYAFRILVDSITVLAAWWCTYWIRFILMEHSGGPLRNFMVFSPLVLLIYLYYIDLHSLMDKELIEDWAEEFTAIIKVCGKSFFAIILFFYFIDYGIFSRLSLFIFFFVSLVFLTIERIIIDNVMAKRRKKGKQVKRIFLLGDDPKLHEYARHLLETPEKGMIPICWYDAGQEIPDRINMVQGDLIGAIEAANVDMVVVGYGLDKETKLNQGLIRCYDLLIPVVVLADLPYTFLNNQMEKEGDYNLFFYNSFYMSMTNRVVKRLIDIIGALVGLILSIPLYLVIPIIIKISSPGPVFYGQKRMTQNGRIFTMWKFRSMRSDAESGTGAVWATKGDDRTTPIGKFLRSTSLDEFPQFWNVLKGEMSLVGPRPERPELIEKFRNEIPGYMLRHKMKAGITGWAQVNGLRGNTSLHRRVEYDLYYINNWSQVTDIKILFLTFIKGFINENAY